MKDFVLHEEAKDLLHSWYDARDDGLLPTRRFIDPVRLRRWVGDISVIHLHEGEKRLYVALHGANVARHLGPDFNRKYLEDVIPESAMDDALAPYDLSIETRLPTYSIQEQTLWNGLHKTLERMVMPCGIEGSGEVDRFLIWVAPIAEGAMPSTSVYDPCEDEGMEPVGEEGPEQTATVFLLSQDYTEDTGTT